MAEYNSTRYRTYAYGPNHSKRYLTSFEHTDYGKMADDQIAAGKWGGWPRHAVIDNLRRNAERDRLFASDPGLLSMFTPLQGDN